MKAILLISGLVLTLTSCGNNSAKSTDGTTTMHTDAHKEVAEAKDPNAKVDPVCDMPKKADWTEFSVVNKDTTWFCSPHCKETFDKDPAKFAKK
ncbi:hypothetical protein DBR32_09050 [Taibaiella sp. KBW10]|uniref:YHS domain-containing protein n=1 Tax=Taibaiella sp. KBW10 TaxID=2153357 RepID=UPI000F595F25|nr:YHS domain-containing protein [Taibaiella sp. KBW10]RQO30854.1 hypothetical protein DBR32_09050 [Taibaiella sp. KBW10]